MIVSFGFAERTVLLNNETKLIESATKMNSTNYRVAVEHIISSSDPPGSDCIFLIGGVNCERCIWCYNITYDSMNISNNDSLYLYDTLPIGYGDGTNDGERSVAINDTIYYITQTTIERYNVVTKSVSKLNINFSNITYSGVFMAGRTSLHYNTATLDELYILGTDCSWPFLFMYSLIDDDYEQTLSWASCHYMPAAIVNEYIDGIPYLYKIGSWGGDIQRRNLNAARNSSSFWETLSYTKNGGDLRVKNLKAIGNPKSKYIYILNGYKSI